MSDPNHGTAHPRSEDDHVESRTVVLVGVSALAVFTLAALAAMAYLRHESSLRPAPALPPEIGQTKIGLVEQSLFFDGARLRGDRDRAVRLARLQSLGWVDRPRGVAHLPIDEAMALVAQGVRPARLDGLQAPPLGAARGGADAPSVPVAAPAGTAPAQGVPRAAGQGVTR